MTGTRTPVLVYHTVTDQPSSKLADFTVSPAAFAEHMRLVAQSGRRVISAGEFAQDRSVTDAVVVTFDDGYEDFATHALPVLQRYDIPATLFVTTGWMEDAGAALRGCGPADRMLRLSTLPELVAEGVEIGAHSVTHPHLDTLGRNAARFELESSKATLAQVLARPVETFAYPHGFQSPRLRQQMQGAGYVAAYGVGDAFAVRGSAQMNIPRLMLRHDHSAADVQRWLEGAGAPDLGPHDRVLTRGYRLARRGKALLTGRPVSDWT